MEPRNYTEAKKQRIYDACKTLFYENGYRETTYEDICEKADVTLGTITYHLNGKRNLAQTLFQEYEDEHRKMVELQTGGRFDLRTLTALRIIRWWDRLAKDAKLKRLVTELAEEGIARYALMSHIEYVFQMLVLEYDLYISDRKLSYTASAHVGMTCELLIGMSDEAESKDAEGIADFIIENMFKSLDTDYITIRDLIKRAHELYETLDSDTDYFAYFRYFDEPTAATR